MAANYLKGVLRTSNKIHENTHKILCPSTVYKAELIPDLNTDHFINSPVLKKDTARVRYVKCLHIIQKQQQQQNNKPQIEHIKC